METLFNDFHFLRPVWLLALVALLPLFWWQQHSRAAASGWQQHIAPALLPLLTRGGGGKNRLLPLLLTVLAGAIIGAAGPSWERLPQPVEQNQSALVVVMDLSPSLYAQDITPSRLVRARFKLLDLLNQRGDGLTGLVVYAGEAHVLSPLTEDSNTIAHLVPVLSPSLLVDIGSNLEDAILQAIELIDNGAEQRGDIVLITDGATATAVAGTSELMANHSAVRLSILGVGTTTGAPIPLAGGGFVKAANGAIVLPKLNGALLADLAARHRGIYRDISVDNSDIEALLAHIDQRAITASKVVERDFDQWQDRAHLVALALLLPLALAFRRGVLAIALMVVIPATLSPTASAQSAIGEPIDEPAAAPLNSSFGEQLSQGWRDLWWRRDQQAADQLASGDPSGAAELFERRDWAGTAAYRAGDYASAVEHFYADANPSADALFNRATALARAGELEASLAAYDELLERHPGHQDGRFNRDIVERALQQRQQQQQQQQQEQEQQQQQNDQPHDQNQQSQSQNQAGDDQANQQPPDAASDSQQQSPEQNSPEDQAADPEQQPGEQDQQQDQQQPPQPPKPTAGESNGQPEPAEPAEQPGQLSAAEQAEQEAADRELEQWLRKIDDDPAGLLRAKFRYQSQQRAREQKMRPPPGSDDGERW